MRYDDFKQKQLSNPDVKAEYDALQPEYDLIQALINARKNDNISQKELSKRSGVTQADISRIENGTRNPSISVLNRLANSLGFRFKLEPIA